MDVNINIMGSLWSIEERSVQEEPRLNDCDGFCDWTVKRIVIERERNGDLENMDAYFRKVKRHEILHAFLEECGLAESSCETEAWARNEEMVDWFARNGAKVYAAWRIADAL